VVNFCLVERKFNAWISVLFVSLKLNKDLKSSSKAFRSAALSYELLLPRAAKVTKRALGVPTRE